jgi:hypothetical protein
MTPGNVEVQQEIGNRFLAGGDVRIGTSTAAELAIVSSDQPPGGGQAFAIAGVMDERPTKTTRYRFVPIRWPATWLRAQRRSARHQLEPRCHGANPALSVFSRGRPSWNARGREGTDLPDGTNHRSEKSERQTLRVRTMDFRAQVRVIRPLVGAAMHRLFASRSPDLHHGRDSVPTPAQ